MEVNRPTQKQPSRKGKRSWRKNVNIDDVTQGLEERREDLRTIGDNTNDLFIIDTIGDSNAKLNNKPLKSTQILQARSKVPGLNIDRNNKKLRGVSGEDIHRLMKLAGRVDGVSKTQAKIESDGIMDSAVYDVWGVEEKSIKAKEIPEVLTKSSLHGWTSAKNVPKTLTEKSIVINETELPNEGKSYNPSLEAWKSLINEEFTKEEKRENERNELVAQRENIQKLIKSMIEEEQDESSDDEDVEDVESSEDEDGDDLKLSINRPTETKIKSKTQRNKEKNHAKRMELEQELKSLKKQITELNNLKNIINEVSATEQTIPSITPKIKKQPKKLFKYTNIQPILEVKLSNELSDSLRKLKPEGNLIYDEMRILQNKGKVEARIPVAKRRRYAPKITEKWTYKDFK